MPDPWDDLGKGAGKSRIMSGGTTARLMASLVVLCGALQPVRSYAAELRLETLQTSDGAIVLTPGGNYVEPYFATKALLVAQDAGMDVRGAAQAWIRWALPRQTSRGLFRRFCRSGSTWRDCAPADADDSMLALWMQLAYRMAPSAGMPPDWQRSVDLAYGQLEKLRNRRLHVYHVSQRNHVALLMDNVEVYAALKDIARAQSRLRQPVASETATRAADLEKAIPRVFWDRHQQRFRPSMQKSRPAFYPDVVAQVYPWLANLNGPGQNPRKAWEQWKKAFGRGWIERRYDEHPWGLVAIAADILGDAHSAACWTAQSDSVRGSASWNVLEEAAWQSLRSQFPQPELLNPNNCTALLAQR
jgi:hypothetical protein